MGLDMYLYNSKNEEVGYWRKANHIHNWFVKNVQNNVDDCGSYEVSKEDLKNLLIDCNNVYFTKDLELAKELLPTTSGFFFGSTEYSDGYYEDVKDTIDIINKVLAMEEEKFIYHSSW